jgi:hypothetical protein
MRACSLLLLGLFVTGCDDHTGCQPNTLLVDVQLAGDAVGADTLLVDVSIGNAAPVRTRLAHAAGAANGRVEVEFPSGYPVGQSVTVTLTAQTSGRVVGQSLAIALLGPTCDSTSISIGEVLSDDGGMPGSDGGTVANMPNVPTDPEFKGSGAWTLAGGATIDPTAPGLDDVGELVLDASAICANGGSARQSITLPSFDVAGPLALTHTVSRECTAASGTCAGGTAAVRFRDGALVVPASNTLTKGVTCLGARAYDGTYDFIVGAGDKNDCAGAMPPTLLLRVDRLSIGPESSCPNPGSVRDGNFDGNMNDWGLQLTNGTATIDAGIGVNGSQAGHLTTSQLCQAPKLRGMQSVPMGASVALSLLFKGTMGKPALVGEETNMARWASVTGSGTFDTPRVCVPEYAKGMALPLLLSTETPQGSCATLDMRDFVFDDLTFVTEPSCPATTFVIDPGFERYAAVAQWNLGTDGSAGQATAAVVGDAMQAHGGTYALRLSTKQFCSSARANTTITVPPPTASAGPMLRFFYRAPLLGNATAYATVQNTQVKLAASAGWTQAHACLDPARAGQGEYLEVVVGSSGICGKSFAEEFAAFDDFEVTTDASCPAK